jgi:crossover junction endodeoxyribonuclease RuvC
MSAQHAGMSVLSRGIMSVLEADSEDADIDMASGRQSTIILGIDIGLCGGIATLTSDGDLIDCEDMPCLRDGPHGRPTVNAPLLARIIAVSSASHAYVELINARPGEGPVGAFSFGRSRGCIEGVLGAREVPMTLIMPQVWKREVGIPPGAAGAKNAARAEAIRRWPSKAYMFARARDDGRAEAALIAVAGLQRDRRDGVLTCR